MAERAPYYRIVFGLAALYNLAFGLWAGFAPYAFFDFFHLRPPLYPSIWSCLGMVVGTYGLAYGYAALRLDRAAPFIAIGLLGKVLGPIGWVLTVRSGEWPVRTLTLILFNDIVWWLPFGLFLIDGTRIAARVYRPFAAPPVRSDPMRCTSSIRSGSQPMNSDSAVRSQATPAAVTRKAASTHERRGRCAPHQA